MSTGSEASAIGELVGGKYRIVRLLARGGMGVVYEAQHAVVHRRFAIKFLRRELAERREILTRFQREAEAAGALENENVTAAVDFGITADGAPYIVMEYLVGESLASLLERGGRLPIARAADLVTQACRGVEAAHAAGIVHRDLKPPNLFVCRRDDGTDLLKILDFGVAKLQASEDASTATRSGVVLGTAAYMSPEQARGEKMVDRRADVYALGAILYELVSQRKPHPGESQNAILHHIATQPAVPLASVQPDLPADLVEAVGRALASDPAARPASAGALAAALAPFARRETWPAPPGDSGSATPPSLTSSLTRGAPRSVTTGTTTTRVAFAAGVALAAAAIAVGVGLRARAPERSGARAMATLPPNAQLYVRPSDPAAVQQIARLTQAHDFGQAALLTAMMAVPSATWFVTGSPDQVESEVHNVVVRATHDGGIPTLVANNDPYRDCAGYSAGGARDAAAYRAWIEGFARGIGNEKTIVILEPDSLGIVPYNVTLDGAPERCRPTVTDAEGRTVPAPGASAAERYALLGAAVDIIASQAPSAVTYLDGTNSAWLPVAEIASRLAQAGVERTRGFAVNVASFQPTSEAITYGTWISKCLAYAGPAARNAGRFRDCPGPGRPAKPGGAVDWESAERWYRDNVDRASKSSLSPSLTRSGLAHFVIDTSRNGRGPLDADVYAAPPYNQPPEVIAKLRLEAHCNPPGAGLGSLPTARTGVPLADAYLWIKGPGESDGSCDVAGGARAWDYSAYNPWQVAGEAQRHFDPLWGMVDPDAGQWFHEQALQLARNATPPLERIAADLSAAAVGSEAPPPGHSPGVAPRRPARRPAAPAAAPEPAAPAAPAAPARVERAAPREDAPPPPITFDQQNPYN